jgi:hypothetical protein
MGASTDAEVPPRFPSPSRPGEFHPEALTDPDVSLSTYPARATELKAAASHQDHRVMDNPLAAANERTRRTRLCGSLTVNASLASLGGTGCFSR